LTILGEDCHLPRGPVLLGSRFSSPMNFTPYRGCDPSRVPEHLNIFLSIFVHCLPFAAVLSFPGTKIVLVPSKPPFVLLELAHPPPLLLCLPFRAGEFLVCLTVLSSSSQGLFTSAVPSRPHFFGKPAGLRLGTPPSWTVFKTGMLPRLFFRKNSPQNALGPPIKVGIRLFESLLPPFACRRNGPLSRWVQAALNLPQKRHLLEFFCFIPSAGFLVQCTPPEVLRIAARVPGGGSFCSFARCVVPIFAMAFF